MRRAVTRVGATAFQTAEDRSDVLSRGGVISRFSGSRRIVLRKLRRSGRAARGQRSSGRNRQPRNVVTGAGVSDLS
jgi:hypothetical protein